MSIDVVFMTNRRAQLNCTAHATWLIFVLDFRCFMMILIQYLLYGFVVMKQFDTLAFIKMVQTIIMYFEKKILV